MDYLLRERDRDRLIGLLDTAEGGLDLDDGDDGAGVTPRAAVRLARGIIDGTRPLGKMAPAGVWVARLAGERVAFVGPALEAEVPDAAILRILALWGRTPVTAGRIVGAAPDWHLAVRVDNDPEIVGCTLTHHLPDAVRRYAFLRAGQHELAVLPVPAEAAIVEDVLAGLVLTQAPDFLLEATHPRPGGAIAVARHRTTDELVAFELRDEGAA